MPQTVKKQGKYPGGRNLKEVDIDVLYELAKIQCTMKEMSSVLKISVDTLERRFADVIKEAQEEGRSSLRRAQYKLAMNGNCTMLIWLGKHLLDQKEDKLVGPTFEPEVRMLLKKFDELTWN